jgi:hypothetical protein
MVSWWALIIPMRHRLTLISLAMAVQVGAFGATDYMKTFRVEVCGASVSMELHPNMTAPGVEPQNLSDSRIPNPGDIAEFVHVMYDYRGSRQFEMDGSLVVVGTVMRRTIKRRDRGISFFDIDRLLESMKETAPEFAYEKLERSSGAWIKRTKLKDMPAGQGRNVGRIQGGHVMTIDK